MRIMKKQCAVYGLFLISMLFSASSYSWGALGHQISCDIAWRLSSPRIQAVLSQTAVRMGYKTYAQSCVWADTIKSQPSFKPLKPLHYINVPKDATSVQQSLCLRQKRVNCVITAINYYVARINHRSLSQKERDQALLLSSHFIADVHQPLHVSYAEDRGGTGTKVIFEGKLMSLHRLWDSSLLYCRPLIDRSLGKVSTVKNSWRSMGLYLYQQLVSTGQGVVGASVNSPVSVWADESLLLTRAIYRDIEAVGHQNSAENATGSNHLSHSRNRVLAANYCAQYHSIVVERLQLAGVRLARKLAVALAP